MVGSRCPLSSLFRDIGADSQGEDYHYNFTLPSQSQLEDNFKTKLTIHEGIEETREPGGGELQFEDEDDEGLGGGVGGGFQSGRDSTCCSYCGISDPDYYNYLSGTDVSGHM